MPILLELPLSVVQGAHLPGFEPPRDAVEMKSVVTDSPSNRALFRSSWGLVGLTLDTKIHNVVPADGTVINHNIQAQRATAFHLLTSKLFLPAPLLVPLRTSTPITAAILETHGQSVRSRSYHLIKTFCWCTCAVSPSLLKGTKAKTRIVMSKPSN